MDTSQKIHQTEIHQTPTGLLAVYLAHSGLLPGIWASNPWSVPNRVVVVDVSGIFQNRPAVFSNVTWPWCFCRIEPEKRGLSGPDTPEVSSHVFGGSMAPQGFVLVVLTKPDRTPPSLIRFPIGGHDPGPIHGLGAHHITKWSH